MKLAGPASSRERDTLGLNRCATTLFWLDDVEDHRGDPERKLAFRVPINNTVWSYELEPTATGTKLIETRHAENGVDGILHDERQRGDRRRAEL